MGVARTEWWRLGAIGLAAGLLSGLLGVGGGILMVPAFVGWVRLPIKEAVGCSLACVGILAIPGTITHALLGHIDWTFALAALHRGDPRRAGRRAPRDPVVRARRCASRSRSCSATIAVIYAAGEILGARSRARGPASEHRVESSAR